MSDELNQDLRAYAIVPGSVLLDMKRYMDRVSGKSKGTKADAELASTIRNLLGHVKEHVAIVDWIESEVDNVIAAHNPDPEAPWVMRDCDIAKDMKRVMRHVALKVLGERVEREDASAVSRLERIGLAISQMHEDIRRDGTLAVGVMHDDAIANEARQMVLGLLAARADDDRDAVEFAKVEAELADMTKDINDGIGIRFTNDDTQQVGAVKNAVGAWIDRLQAAKREGFNYGTPENRQEIGVFLSHVLPRIRHIIEVPEVDLIDELLDGIALVGTGAINALDAARARGDEPSEQINTHEASTEAIKYAVDADNGLEFLSYWNEGEFGKCRLGWPDAPEDCYKGLEHRDIPGTTDGQYQNEPKHYPTPAPDDVKMKIVAVKDALGVRIAKALIASVGRATELNLIDPHEYKPFCDACDLLLEAFESGCSQAKSAAYRARVASTGSPDVLQNRWLGDVLTFNLAGGRTIDEFNTRMIGLHTGLQLEELAEKLRAVAEALPHGAVHLVESFPLIDIVGRLEYLGGLFKSGTFDRAIDHANPVELADGDIDQMVVSFGSLHSQGVDLFPILHAVTDANLAKRIDGKLILDANGKVKKPDGWKPADLRPFLHKSKRPGPETARAEDEFVS